MAGKKTEPIALHQITNYDLTLTFFGIILTRKIVQNVLDLDSPKQVLKRGARNRMPTWFKDEDIKCNRLTMKSWEETVSLAHLLPQVEIFSSFSKTEMSKDSFLVLQVEGMWVNGNANTRNKSIGHITIIRTKQNMGPFFE